MTSFVEGAEWMCTMSDACPRCVIDRSIAMTGVMPLPAVTRSNLGGGGSGRAKAPCGEARRTIVPAFAPLTKWVDRKPSGVALTVIEISFLSRRGVDVSEYDRQCHR